MKKILILLLFIVTMISCNNDKIDKIESEFTIGNCYMETKLDNPNTTYETYFCITGLQSDEQFDGDLYIVNKNKFRETDLEFKSTSHSYRLLKELKFKYVFNRKDFVEDLTKKTYSFYEKGYCYQATVEDKNPFEKEKIQDIICITDKNGKYVLYDYHYYLYYYDGKIEYKSQRKTEDIFYLHGLYNMKIGKTENILPEFIKRGKHG